MTPQQIRQAQVLKISEKAQCRNRRGTFMARAPFRHTTFFNIFYLHGIYVLLFCVYLLFANIPFVRKDILRYPFACNDMLP